MLEIILSVVVLIVSCVVLVKILSHDGVSKRMTALIAILIPISLFTIYYAVINWSNLRKLCGE
jgi:bacteriorhodopsin